MQPVLLMNPKRGKKSAGKKRGAMTARQAQYFTNPKKRRHHHHRRFLRNPKHVSIGHEFSSKGISAQIGPAITGAAGALMLDWAFANLPLPTMLTSGIMLTVSRIGGAIAIGAIAGRVGGREFGHKAAAGALVVTSYSIIKGFMQTSVPQIALARYVPMNGILQLGKGAAAPGHGAPAARRVAGMGFLNPAQVAGPIGGYGRYNVTQSRY